MEMYPVLYNRGRSSFYDRIDEAVRGSSGRSQPVRVELGPCRWNRNVAIEIRADDTEAFRTSWKGDQGYFSARLRAAATVLRDRGIHGRFRAIHADGLLTLSR